MANATTQKFSEDEMKQIQDLQNNYQNATSTFGRLRVQKLILEQQLDNILNEEETLEKAYTELQKKEQSLVQSLNEKYGAGTLDIVSGEFTPAPTSESAQGPSATPNS